MSLLLSGQAPPSSRTFWAGATKGKTRHDNDHPNIEDIRIFPTFDEVAFGQSEYLPLEDPKTWHKQGSPGLLDRHFRLLREDSIYKIRERLRLELQSKGTSNHSTEGLITRDGRTFHGVRMSKCFLEPFVGLKIVLNIPQPRVKSSYRTMQAYWESCPNLKPGSLVCLVAPTKRLLFCKIMMPPPDKSTGGLPKVCSSLFKSPTHPIINLEPVGFDPAFLQDLMVFLATSPPSGSTFALVDFPGIVLPAWYPALKHLQGMSLSGKVPFEDLLCPRPEGGIVSNTPPDYTTATRVPFDLSAICNHGRAFFFNALSTTNEANNFAVGLSSVSTLDPSQSLTVTQVLSRRLALLQGPPGTGKSFVGVQLIRVLASMKRTFSLGPIICVCYTNHALDQLLEHLLDHGIDNIVRIGSKSKSERIQKLNLRDKKRKARGGRAERRNCNKDLQQQASTINNAMRELIASQEEQRLGVYLTDQNPRHAKQMFPSRNGPRSRQTTENSLKEWLRGSCRNATGDRGRSIQEMQKMSVDDLTNPERHRLYDFWQVDMAKHNMRVRIGTSLNQYTVAREKKKVLRDTSSVRNLETADVIGLTSSGFASNRPMLERLGCKILVCEEAGEVLEAHMLATLMPSLQHVIMIGDHLQLRPQVEHHLSSESKEGKRICLDTSLFERLVSKSHAGGCRLPFSMLCTQRRMHPDIANLVRSTLYPKLTDDPPERVHKPIRGLKKRLFWLDHATAEVEPGHGDTSFSNDFEVSMVVALTGHILKQGQFREHDIAVITPYLGQMQKLHKALGRSFKLAVDQRDVIELKKGGIGDGISAARPASSIGSSGIRLATVDNFQGEESKVVIISLVRSNEQQRCGFLSTPNRINVLLSRAQHGMYIVGDAGTFYQVPMWRQIIDLLRASNSLGMIELECPRHPTMATRVLFPEEFENLSPDGGCALPCLHTLDCGHGCPMSCHSDIMYSKVRCMQCPGKPLRLHSRVSVTPFVKQVAPASFFRMETMKDHAVARPSTPGVAPEPSSFAKVSQPIDFITATKPVAISTVPKPANISTAPKPVATVTVFEPISSTSGEWQSYNSSKHARVTHIPDSTQEAQAGASSKFSHVNGTNSKVTNGVPLERKNGVQESTRAEQSLTKGFSGARLTDNTSIQTNGSTTRQARINSNGVIDKVQGGRAAGSLLGSRWVVAEPPRPPRKGFGGLMNSRWAGEEILVDVPSVSDETKMTDHHGTTAFTSSRMAMKPAKKGLSDSRWATASDETPEKTSAANDLAGLKM